MCHCYTKENENKPVQIQSLTSPQFEYVILHAFAFHVSTKYNNQENKSGFSTLVCLKLTHVT